ncbi:15-hydroxyprostaglandin dehydrogenase [NAD(+)]-like [Pectinophora gossypiella]|uniref:15-hydroxyprostaglandin dehydrogenase [NAD(+)]-like n=1 Tax=Pectinophora gossypiella TaxID=13191 RepID=UPI00214EA3A7|nr:15-hydroxyprostaglandin dehydrogenase [NAD(+)]-like [Pectinophora gossypiella]
MDRNLKDKVVVITGGAIGIGFEIADRYLEKGAKVTVLLDINEKEGAEAVKVLTTKYGNNRAVFIKCDVTKDLEQVFTKIINTYKNVDVLVNNAGILDDTAIKKTIDLNVTAVIEWSMKFWEHMRKEKGGKGGTIVNLASIYGFRIDQFLPTYQASKFAVMGFTKSLGHKYNYDRTGVRVVAICPGFTETKLTSNPKTWKDEQLQVDLFVFLKGLLWQKVDAVGKAAVDIFEKADSGTAWLIEGAKPISQVP